MRVEFNKGFIDEGAQRHYKEEGYLVVPSLYEQYEVERIIELYEKRWVELISSGEIVQDPDAPASSLFPRIYNFDRKNEELLSYLLDARLFGNLGALVGEEVLLIATSYYFKPSGAKGLPMHQDDYVFGIEPGTVLSAWLSLDSADSENGGMLFVPKSHQLGLLVPEADDTLAVFSDEGRQIKVPDGYETVRVDTQPGDVIFFDGYSIHASTANVSANRFRRALLIQFAGISTTKLLPNFNNLLNSKGERVRKRLNTEMKLVENQSSIFSAQSGKYFDTWK